MTIEVPLHIRSSDINTDCWLRWWISHLYEEELPEPVWFPLGTSIHSGIEYAIDEEASLKVATGYAISEYETLKAAAGGTLMESPVKNKKRSMATAHDDIKRMMGKWFDHVHPDGDKRIEYFDELEWPPLNTERTIRVETPSGIWLRTQLDALFQHKTYEFVTPIVDWKSGATAGKAKNLQLWTYQYGGRLEGWIDERQRFPGVFIHVDHLGKKGGVQHVGEYPGDLIIHGQIKQTHMMKKYTILEGPLPAQDWWCNYCPAKTLCPVEGDGEWGEIYQLMEQVEQVEIPPAREEKE